ncbi:hypothetical protein HR060_09195 [Catenovulum sp. SM1970]|uniref:hypothetical protein n=1 Tax=Marinifaba aquimaris TaxID=2741323 RepID=UPI001574B90B|nr:hypothetical protein [Marinifaba aquimaris]NTS77047.1 hypothetical protein [Marinifaba aquimaris]
MKKLLSAKLAVAILSLAGFSSTASADNCTWELVYFHSYLSFQGAEYKSVGACPYRGKLENYRTNTVHYW